MRMLLLILPLFLITGCIEPTGNDNFVVSMFNSINKIPTVISFENSKKINNRGGHLQGVQLVKNDKNTFVVLSGSSGSYAYNTVVKLDNKNKVILLNRLMDKPYKHAGGFQIFENYLAVGIEDNEEKDKSKICIYDISEPEKPLVKPFALINRSGKSKRSTAGCVGITKFKNQILLAVGDWDTKHIDFYSCKFDEIENNSFKSIYTIDTEKQSKENWTDNNWYPYQNINLFTFSNNKLYLIGLGQNNGGENIADLFRLNEDDSGNFSLIKLASRMFKCENKSSFKAGAGIYLTSEGNFEIVSCGYDIERLSYLNFFKIQTNK